MTIGDSLKDGDPWHRRAAGVIKTLFNTYLAAFVALGTGIVVVTGTGTYAARTITGPAAGITVSNGSGVSGDPTLALANDLSALEGLSSTGIAARTGTDTWAQRTITGTSGNIAVSNGSGASANPTIDFDTSALAGWMEISDSWSYSAVSGIIATITVPSDATARYALGDRVRLKQGAGYLYFYVVGIPSTTSIKVSGGADYTLANSSITNVAISKWINPNAFPEWFTWAPTFTGFSADPSGGTYYFRMVGDTVSLSVHMPNNGTSNATGFTMTAPFTSASISQTRNRAPASVTDNGAKVNAAGQALLSSNTTTITLYSDYSEGAATWTNANGKRASFSPLVYRIKDGG